MVVKEPIEGERTFKNRMTTARDTAWLIDASYDAGHVTLTLLGARELEPIRWIDSTFQPYYLTSEDQQGDAVKKQNLFTQEESTLRKVNYSRKPPKNINARELEINPP